jgi:hypothetical protein
VTCIEGDALKTLHDIEGPVDFVFIDAVKSDYMKYLKILEPKLARNAVIVGDNVIRSARAMKDFLDYIQNSPDYDTVIIRASMEKNDGMSVSYKIRRNSKRAHRPGNSISVVGVSCFEFVSSFELRASEFRGATYSSTSSRGVVVDRPRLCRHGTGTPAPNADERDAGAARPLGTFGRRLPHPLA